METLPHRCGLLAWATALFLGATGQGQTPPLDPQIAAAMRQAQKEPIVRAEFEPNPAALGSRITYRLHVAANAEGVSVPERPPTPAGMTLKSVGRALGYTITTNIVDTFLIYNYRAQVEEPGDHLMPPFTVIANGRTVPVPPVTLRLLPPGDPAARQAPTLVADLPQPLCYVGQSVPVRATLVEPGPNQLSGLGPLDILSDAVIAETGTARNWVEPRIWQGQPTTAYMADMLVTPIQEGRLAITALLQAVPVQPTPSTTPATRTSTLFDSDPVILGVRHVPTVGRRPGFNGAIGTLQIDPPRLSTNRLRLGEALTLLLTVRGSNALVRFNPPKPVTVPEWQMLPPVPDGMPPALHRNRGFATFTYTLVPLSAVVTATPAIPFSSFDPEKQTYIDLTIPAVPVTVLPAPGAPPVAGTSPPQRVAPAPAQTEEGLVLPGLAQAPGWPAASLTPPHQRRGFLALQLLPAAALAWCAWRERRRRLHEAHPEILLYARARRGMRVQLRRRRRALAVGDSVEALAATAEALREFASPAVGGHATALVSHDILAALPPDRRHSAESPAIREVFDLLDARRFRESAIPPERAAALVEQLENLLHHLRASLARNSRRRKAPTPSAEPGPSRRVARAPVPPAAPPNPPPGGRT